jgi:hypothetical protein
VADASINVDTDGLKQFADNVGFYATEIDPVDVGRSKQEFAAGVTFGLKNASGAVHVAKENYANALSVSLQNLAGFVEAAKILADAAEQVAADFGAADGRAADSADLVEKQLYDASRRAIAARGGYQPAADDGEA